VTEASRKASKATVALKAITVSEEAKVIANISYYLRVKRSVIFITS
jgi:hypothetical protein